MLALLGLMSAMFAGALAETLTTRADTGDAPDDDSAITDGDGEGASPPTLDIGDESGGQTGEPPAEGVDSVDDGDTVGVDVSVPDDSTGDNPGEDGTAPSDDLPDPVALGATLNGTSGDDLLSGLGGDDLVAGGDGNDQIDGRAGDDVLEGGTGDDLAHGGLGDDSLSGGAGEDTLHGEDGDDGLLGGDGDDSLLGHAGNDVLEAGAGNDSVLGGSGADGLHGAEGDDWLAGGDGDDVLVGGAGGDTLDGNDGNDRLAGTDDAFPDFLNGGEGDDALTLGAGDYGHGGAGADVFTLADWVAEGGIATISDYDAAEDDIVVVYDAAAHSNPELTLETEAGNTTILLDGSPVAVVTGGVAVDLSAIVLAAA